MTFEKLNFMKYDCLISNCSIAALAMDFLRLAGTATSSSEIADRLRKRLPALLGG